MAQYLTRHQLRNFEVDGKWFNLEKLVEALSRTPDGWVSPQKVTDLTVGQVVHVWALGDRLRRGVVTKLGRTKATVAFTTQGAIDDTNKFHGDDRIRVADSAVQLNMIKYPAPAAPVEPAAEEFTETERAELSQEFDGTVEAEKGNPPAWWPNRNAVIEKAHAEALAMDQDAKDEHSSDYWETVTKGLPRVPVFIEPTAGEVDQPEELTPNSQDCKVGNMTDDKNTAAYAGQPGMVAYTETETAPAENHTGSAVVALLEKVWSRIREESDNELPEIVIVTGSGLLGAGKWGHFRPDGWKETNQEGPALRKHELFLAGEALAKGARQVLQTMLHEAAHTLARVRDLKDTSRQGRWHNATFRKLAEEMGLEHRASSADSAHGFSFVTLTGETTERYADLLAELDREIRMMCDLPLWLGGSSDGDNEPEGGEKIAGKPKGEGSTGTPQSGNLKATCACPERNIIRASRKVLDLGVIRCDECECVFTAV